MPKEYKVTEGQTLQDIALIVYGDVTKAFQLVLDNIDTVACINTIPATGSLLKYTETQSDVVAFFEKRSKPATLYPRVKPARAFAPAFNISQFSQT